MLIFKFLNNLVDAVFSSIWILFTMFIGFIVVFIIAVFLWGALDLTNTWWKWLLLFAVYFLLYIIGVSINRKFNKNWSKNRKKGTQEILKDWKDKGII